MFTLYVTANTPKTAAGPARSSSGSLVRAGHSEFCLLMDCFHLSHDGGWQMWPRLRKVREEQHCWGMDSSHVVDVCLTSSGPQPAVSRGTHITMPLVEVATDPLWEAAVVKQDGNRINLSVKSPSTAAIGRYQLTVETNCASGRVVSAHDPANDVYVLFNPWCKGRETPRSAVSCSPTVEVLCKVSSVKSVVISCSSFLVNLLFACWLQVKREDELLSSQRRATVTVHSHR